MLNKQTKKIQFISLLSTLFLASAINAAEPNTPQTQNTKVPQDRFEMMSQKLELTEKQKKELKPMLEKLKKNRAEVLKKLDEQETKELSSILKPEQIGQVQRYLKRSQRMGGGNREGMRKGDMEKRNGNGGQKNGMYPKPPAKLPAAQ